MFRMQLSAGVAIIDGLLNVGLSDKITSVGLLQGVLTLTLGLLIAYQSVKRVSADEYETAV
ncbi:hypothetical protein CA54_26180 [Symmachiella macrocystis]|uniref:Uncharacterized protein n=1 Tax=Symmachiella macrocystis TaxID=2527985 RepID=A0A5C6BNN0_9PLAN|nr:hypothetical protein [Symmachiella macrocystis]TWU13783.1 hypothetical protein CA54_26180 [Symmachiella macrocystis]